MRVRVLVCDHTVKLSGGEVVLARNLAALCAEPFDFVVAVPSASGTLPEALQGLANVEVREVRLAARFLDVKKEDALRRVIRAPWLLKALLQAVVSHARLAVAIRADVIMTNSLKSHIYGTLAAVVTGRPVVWYFHDYFDAHYFPGWLRAAIGTMARWMVSRVICVSEAAARAFAETGIDPERLSVCHGAPPVSPISGCTVFREELGLEANEKMVCMVGRIAAPKGQLEFVHAAFEVLRRRPETMFVIIGTALFGNEDVNYELNVSAAAQDARAHGRVRLLGARADALSAIAAANIVIAHSLWPEGFPTVVVEGMAAGRPVISTAVGGAVELVKHEETALEVSPGDVKGLAEAILRLLDDEDYARALGARGERHVESLFKEKGVERLAAILRNSRRGYVRSGEKGRAPST